MRQRLGMAEPGAFGADAEGTHKADSLPRPRRSATTPHHVTGAFGRLGALHARDWLASVECHRSAVVASGFGAAVGVDSSRPGEGAKSDSGAAQRGSGGAH